MSSGHNMIQVIKDLWDYPRSLTGHGVVSTLDYIKGISDDLEVHTFESGEVVFDWEIPDEWNIYGATLKHESGLVIADFSENNLHVLGYSTPCSLTISKEDLLEHLYTIPELPDAIPYVTSYYNECWGFCISENQKKSLPEGMYHVDINATKGPGKLHLADVFIPGETKSEVFFSTYVCHPSMANNELSGPALSLELIRYIKETYPNPRMSYRFAFVPETIGAIAYLSKNYMEMKKKIKCGFVLSCVGDDQAYSHIESRLGNSLADKALESSFINLPNAKKFSYLYRGSDERQYCAPGIDLPLCGFCRTRYGDYPEYHTSADDLSLVNPEGLAASFKVMKNIIDAFEIGLYPRATVLCEPQLGKRGLYPSITRREDFSEIYNRLNFLSYADGNHSLFDIATISECNLSDLVPIAKIMTEHGLVKNVEK
ncbi:DUF4910 domain-containing protein [Desulfovibrio sp. JC022]|nr:DUF4910 domain-containing protein [Desulfovibrio sp. JC022]